MSHILTYQSWTASRYIPVDAAQVGLRIAESAYYLASIKHDGHLAFLEVRGGTVRLLDRNGDALDVPGIRGAAAALREDVLLAGELCCFLADRPTTHREVSAALARPAEHDLRFGAFDILEHGGKPVEAEPRAKADLLRQLLPAGPVYAIEQRMVESRRDLIAFQQEAAAAGAEGIVVRSASGLVYKVKQVHHLDLVVLGYAESTGDRQGWLRDLLLGFALGEDRYQVVGKCGGGFSDQERQDLPARLAAMAVPSAYTEVSGARTAFTLVRPELVVEVSCLDLINTTASGPITKACLAYTEAAGYALQGNAPTLSIISPNFVRLRADKRADPHDAGTAQAYSLVEPARSAATVSDLRPSEVLLREVYTKGGKGGTAVRKFVGLRTHKEAGGAYPPYLVVFTDYSAGRKTPLEQELFLCTTEDALHARVEALRTEHIKKGWGPATA
jgi:ATP-dependent DNA ligase